MLNKNNPYLPKITSSFTVLQREDQNITVLVGWFIIRLLKHAKSIKDELHSSYFIRNTESHKFLWFLKRISWICCTNFVWWHPSSLRSWAKRSDVSRFDRYHSNLIYTKSVPQMTPFYDWPLPTDRWHCPYFSCYHHLSIFLLFYSFFQIYLDD